LPSKVKILVANRAMALDQNKKTGPLSDAEMDGLMEALGPFEGKPHIAVAVSGGADSLALTVLCKAWVDRRSGTMSALSVDHGMREGSGAEIEQLRKWLAARGIEHTVLRWKGDKPCTGLQAAARIARYDLLGKWCRATGVLHLLLGHHQEDQAETFLLRLGHNSGIDGLAGMAGIVEKSHMRLLRPLLSIPKARLRVTLKAASQLWLEDPSNESEAFERVRIRNSLPELATLGLTPVGISETAGRMARARVALEAEASRLLATSCSVDPAGYACFDAVSLFSGPDEISLRALARALLCVGAGEYAPRMAKLEKLHEKMKAAYQDRVAVWKGATLAGCRILPLKGRAGVMTFLMCREERSLPAVLSVWGGMEMDWDNRFRLHLRGLKSAENKGTRLQALGRDGWAALCGEAPSIRRVSVPIAVSMTLPTLVDNEGIVAVPHLNYRRANLNRGDVDFARADFHPKQTLSGPGFTVAK
jgi:tRNA(Ile)-lysidine synthase